MDDSLTDCLKPVVTQALQAQKIKSDKGLDQYCGNVSMKIHCKLGGVTHQVQTQALDVKTMMLGADVSVYDFAELFLITVRSLIRPRKVDRCRPP